MGTMMMPPPPDSAAYDRMMQQARQDSLERENAVRKERGLPPFPTYQAMTAFNSTRKKPPAAKPKPARRRKFPWRTVMVAGIAAYVLVFIVLKVWTLT